MTACSFSIFQYLKLRPSAMLNVKKFGIIVIMRHRAKFRSVEIMTIYHFSNMAAVCHLGFVVRVWTAHKEHYVVFIVTKIWLESVQCSFGNIMFLDIASLVPKCMFSLQISFWGFDPMRRHINESPKGTSLSGKTSWDLRT